MKKRLWSILLVCAMIFSCAAGAMAQTHVGAAEGYNGPLKVEVDLDGKDIKDIRIVEDQESSPVKKRAFPLIVERILEAQTPQVDSLSGATFSSFAVKTAVVEALKDAGIEVGKIDFLPEKADDKRVDLPAVSTSLLVVGGGPAGLSAAIQAVQSGLDPAKVMVVEKLDILGGNGKFDIVVFQHANTKAQKDAGIEDSADALYEARKQGAWDTDERLRKEADVGVTMDEWYREMGIELNYVYDMRTHQAEADAYAGEALLDGLEKCVKELGIQVVTGTKAYDFIMDDARLAGVKVQSGNEYYDITADAVVIATGGFCWNPELLAKYTAKGSELLRSSNQMGATGDMVPLFENYGFQLGHMENTVVIGFMISRGRELTGERVAPQSTDYMLVNKDGNRFTTEETSYGLPRAMDVLAQPDGKAFMIVDQGTVDFSFRIGKHAKEGLMEKAGTLEELAEKLGVNGENLVKTAAAYNDAAAGKTEDAFRKNPPSRPLNAEGPYYGVQIESAMHMTKGGVSCDELARCLDLEGKVIPGAYAAGEVTDTSGNFNQAFIFGRVAGEEAAKFILGD